MKIFGITVETKKDLRAKIAELESENDQIRTYNQEISISWMGMRDMFPFDIGDTVYDLQLRDETGKYTKTKASREHSLINEVEVTEANYFNLKKRHLRNDVFSTLEDAKYFLDKICVN